jgi:hypothetical protein
MNNEKYLLEMTMRTLIPAVFFFLSSFANADPQISKPSRSGVSTCKSRCSVQYKFCTSHATTKDARKACAAVRKTCKGQCG